MNDTAICYNNSPTHNQSNSNYSFYLLKDLSSTAKYLYIELRRIAGVRGFLSYSAKDLSEVTGKSEKQTRRLLHELEANSLIEIWLHPGHESEYIVKDVYFRQGMDICVQPFKKKRIKELTVRENGVSLSIVKTDPEIQPDHVGSDPREDPGSSAHNKTASEPVIEPKNVHVEIGKNPTRATPIRFDLVREILDLTQDTKSTRFWVKFVRLAPLPTVYLAISSLKIAIDEGIVLHPGRYMVGIIKRVYPELFFTQPTTLEPRSSQPQQKIDAPIYGKSCESEPPVVRDPQFNMSQLKQIRAMLERKTS
jgi:hypothetical protein